MSKSKQEAKAAERAARLAELQKKQRAEERRRNLMIGAVAVLVLAVIGTGFFLLSKNNDVDVTGRGRERLRPHHRPQRRPARAGDLRGLPLPLLRRAREGHPRAARGPGRRRQGARRLPPVRAADAGRRVLRPLARRVRRGARERRRPRSPRSSTTCSSRTSPPRTPPSSRTPTALIDLAVEAGAVEESVKAGIEAGQNEYSDKATQEAEDAGVSGDPDDRPGRRRVQRLGRRAARRARAERPAMPSPARTPTFIAGLPKAELHVHHVGSASMPIVAELAERHPGTVPSDPDALRAFYEFRDFAHFIEVYLAVVGPDPHARRRPLPDLRGGARARHRPVGPLRRADLHAVHVGRSPASPSRPTPRRSRTRGSPPSATSGSCCAGSTTSPASPGIPAADATLALRPRRTAPEAWSASGSAGPRSACRGRSSQPHFERRARRRAALGAARRRDHRAGDDLGRPAPARRRAHRPRHLGGRRPGAARAPRRARASRSRCARRPTSPPAPSRPWPSTRCAASSRPASW